MIHLFIFLFFSEVNAFSQYSLHESSSFFFRSDVTPVIDFFEFAEQHNSINPIDTSKISFIDSSVVILEYNSVFDVHTTWDSINYPNIRSAPGDYDIDRILKDLESVIEPDHYDFVLPYGERE